MQDLSNDSIVTINDRCILWCIKISTVKFFFLCKQNPCIYSQNSVATIDKLVWGAEDDDTILVSCHVDGRGPTSRLDHSEHHSPGVSLNSTWVSDISIDFKPLSALILSNGCPDSDLEDFFVHNFINNLFENVFLTEPILDTAWYV
jgi:hypothetical protein